MARPPNRARRRPPPATPRRCRIIEMTDASLTWPAGFNPVRLLGRSTLGALRKVGSVAIFAGRGVAAAASAPWFFGQLLRQLAQVGFFSLPVVGLTAVFTGAALALNIFTG